MENRMVDVIIPVYRPDETLRLLLQKLQEQTFVVHKVIIANTEQKLWEEYIEQQEMTDFLEHLSLELEIFHVSKKDFDHGGTRRLAVARSRTPYFICMTQDAMPMDQNLVERLLEREPYPAPRFILDPSVTDFYAFTRDSVKLEGYQAHPLDEKIRVAV